MTPPLHPQLALRKCGYSRDPWRIGLVHPDGSWQELTYLTYPLKRDAAPVLAALQALDAPWHLPLAQWPEDQRQGALALVAQAPGWQTWFAATRRRAEGV